MSNIPGFVQKIRSGDFAGAQDELANAAYDKIVAGQVNAEVARINEEAGPYSKYVRESAAQKVHEAYQQGKIQTPQDLVNTYQHAIHQEVETFKNAVRPGYMRTESEPYLPADQEIRDYIAERRQRQAELKEEGRRISTLPLR